MLKTQRQTNTFFYYFQGVHLSPVTVLFAFPSFLLLTIPKASVSAHTELK